MGIDDKSENAYCIYWLMKQIITVEHNIYWRPLECGIEGEEEVMHPSDATLAYVNNPQPRATAKSSLSLPQPHATINTKTTMTPPTPDLINAPRLKQICQPSQRVLDIINGKALNPALPCHVCHLCKILYGLKQSGQRWYQKLIEILVKNLGFKLCEVDQAVFIKRSKKTLIIIVVHVDDCTITASTLALVVELKVQIRNHVEIMDLSKLHWLLGIKVTRNREERTIALSQQSYLELIIHHFRFNDLKPVSTPMEPHIKLTNAQSPSTGTKYASIQHIPYRKAIGSLMYATLGTHPDISYAISTISHFLSNPRLPHWEAVR